MNAAEHTHGNVVPDPAWRFGHQDGKAEEGEIRKAKNEGRAEEYTAAQRCEACVAHALRLARSERAKRAAATRRRNTESVRRSDSLFLPENPKGDDKRLARYARGELEPVHVPIPEGLSPVRARIARHVALVIGLRLAEGETRPAVIGGNWVEDRTGVPQGTVSKTLNYFVRIGFLSDEGSLPPRSHPNGTRLFGVPGVTTKPEMSSGRPTPELLLGRALERVGPARHAAFWLACQLRDNGYDEYEDALRVLDAFAAEQPPRFTSSEAARILRSAYSRPARGPWGTPATASSPEPSHVAPQAAAESGAVPVEAEHVGAVGAAVEPRRESPQEGGVVDAVLAGGSLPGTVASGHRAPVLRSGVTGRVRHASRSTSSPSGMHALLLRSPHAAVVDAFDAEGIPPDPPDTGSGGQEVAVGAKRHAPAPSGRDRRLARIDGVPGGDR